jgi:hypothetical protein
MYVVALVGLTDASGEDHDRVWGVSHEAPFSGQAEADGLTYAEAEELAARMNVAGSPTYL